MLKVIAGGGVFEAYIEAAKLLSEVIRSNQKSSERIQSESEALQNISEIRQKASEEASCELLILF